MVTPRDRAHLPWFTIGDRVSHGEDPDRKGSITAIDDTLLTAEVTWDDGSPTQAIPFRYLFNLIRIERDETAVSE